MKIAVTSMGETLESPVDPRFGRGRYLLVYDTEKEDYEVIDNQANVQAAQGAGVQAAQAVASAGAEVLLTGHCGPRAFSVLQSSGVQVVNGATGTVKESIERFRRGELKPAGGADVAGHHGLTS